MLDDPTQRHSQDNTVKLEERMFNSSACSTIECPASRSRSTDICTEFTRFTRSLRAISRCSASSSLSMCNKRATQRPQQRLHRGAHQLQARQREWPPVQARGADGKSSRLCIDFIYLFDWQCAVIEVSTHFCSILTSPRFIRHAFDMLFALFAYAGSSALYLFNK